MIKNKIVGYCSISADKIKADKENKRPFENNIVRCIPLQDINSFTMTEMPSTDDLIIIYKVRFIIYSSNIITINQF